MSAERELQFRPATFRTCIESAFLSTAFGPDFLDREVTRDQFLVAFDVASTVPRGRIPLSVQEPQES